MKAIIATGQGRYADPWHPFSRTSDILASILRDAGIDVVVDGVDAAIARLGGFDLLVVNAGDPWRGEEQQQAEVPTSELAGALDRGIGVLAIHCAVSSLRDYPDWALAIGGMWIPGASFHPPASDTAVVGGTLPNGQSIGDFTCFDERYCRLQRIGDSNVVSHHDGDGSPEPAAWVREVGRSRVAVDVLGHDERSYDSAGHRELVRALAVWALGR